MAPYFAEHFRRQVDVNISVGWPDGAMPRTLFHEALLGAIRRNGRFVDQPGRAELLFPAEDVSMEVHWPRFGDDVYVRGGEDREKLKEYLNRVAGDGRAACLINIHPMNRLPQCFVEQPHMLVADANLHNCERAMNVRTFSFPALPITRGSGNRTTRTILASFRGALSHPVRQQIIGFHDGARFWCEAIDRANHVHKLDARTGAVDSAYAELLSRSVFAFVPRGDSLYSYRLLEVMSFGCIPIVVSDGWILPLDRTIPWTSISLEVPESQVAMIPRMLDGMCPQRIREMRAAVGEVYERYFSSLDAILEGLLAEIESIIKPPPRPPQRPLPQAMPFDSQLR